MDVDIGDRIRGRNHGKLIMGAELAIQDYANNRDFTAAFVKKRNAMIGLLQSTDTADGRSIQKQGGGVLLLAMYWEGPFGEIKVRNFGYLEIIGRFGDPQSGMAYFRNPPKRTDGLYPLPPQGLYPAPEFLWITQADVWRY